MTGPPRLVPGAVLVLDESDYCYGRGTLVLRATEVGADPASFRQLEWVRIVGREIRWDGADGERRDVMVRVAAIGPALRPVGWRPTTRPQ